jgi:hypothetical protein
MKLPPLNLTGYPDLTLEDNAGYGPVRFDYDVGVLLDPITGRPDGEAEESREYGYNTNPEIGAMFSKSLGLWPDPDALPKE